MSDRTKGYDVMPEDDMTKHGWRKSLTFKYLKMLENGKIRCLEYDFYVEDIKHDCGSTDFLWLSDQRSGMLLICTWCKSVEPMGRDFGRKAKEYFVNVNEAIDSIGAASQVGSPIAEGLAAFRGTVQRATNTIGDLVQQPTLLAETIDGLYADLYNLYTSPDDAYNSMLSLFGYGGDDPVVVPDTASKAQRKQNRDLVRANLRVKALDYAYLAAAERTYTTTEDLDAAQAQLEAQYIDARENQLISNETLELLDRLRVQGQATLDNARVNTRTIITVFTPRMPLSVLVYSYYGLTRLEDGTDLVDVIADLNNVTQNAFVEGELQILTA